MTWDVTVQDGAHRLALRWHESGGPAVSAPGRSGFGTMLLRRILEDQLQGSVVFSFDPGGLEVRAEARLPQVV